MSYLIQVNDLNVSFGSQIILLNVSLTLKEEEIITIIGPNGAGKSTLVRAILGLLKVQQGKILLKPGIRIGYMPQKIAFSKLIPITVARFLKLFNNHNDTTQQATILTDLGIEKLLPVALQNISGGELQRVLLARALLNAPNLLILDEPTQGVDLNGQLELYRLINLVKKRYNCGVLMVSHDLHLVMANTDRVICLNKHICCSGDPAMVWQHPEFTAMFGTKFAKEIAFYQHDHDHIHFLDGSISNVP